VIRDCKSPVTSAQFEINFHRPCQLCKEWPRNTSAPRMEPKESWWSDASATRNFSLVVRLARPRSGFGLTLCHILMNLTLIDLLSHG